MFPAAGTSARPPYDADRPPWPGRSPRLARLTKLALLAAPALLPTLVALGVLPLINGGELWPWRPTTVDLEVYRYTGRVLLDGGDILTAVVPTTKLAFIYPAFAALLCVPLVIVPWTLLQILWTAATVGALTAVCHRLGLRGWMLTLTVTVLVLVAEPIRSTLGFGQINVFLLALVCLDLLPSGARRPLLPQGVLTGLAATLKLTPALFIVYLALTRQWRAFWVSLGTFVGTTLVALVLLPRESIGFWRLLLEGDTRTGASHFLLNQSTLSVVTRAVGTTDGDKLLGLALGALIALVCVVAAVPWAQRGSHVFAIGLVGLGTLLASPLSWTHHFVWIVPLGAAVLADRTLPWTIRASAGAFVAWTGACVFRVLLPWGGDVELTYDAGQLLISSIGPALGLVLAVAALLEGIRRGTMSGVDAGRLEPDRGRARDRHPEPEKESSIMRTGAERGSRNDGDRTDVE